MTSGQLRVEDLGDETIVLITNLPVTIGKGDGLGDRDVFDIDQGVGFMHFEPMRRHPLTILHPADLVLAAVLTLLWRKRLAPAGSVFWAYLILYGVSRGSIEYLRGDLGRGVWFDGMLSTSQMLAIVGIVFGLIMWFRGRSRLKVDTT